MHCEWAFVHCVAIATRNAEGKTIELHELEQRLACFVGNAFEEIDLREGFDVSVDRYQIDITCRRMLEDFGNGYGAWRLVDE